MNAETDECGGRSEGEVSSYELRIQTLVSEHFNKLPVFLSSGSFNIFTHFITTFTHSNDPILSRFDYIIDDHYHNIKEPWKLEHRDFIYVSSPGRGLAIFSNHMGKIIHTAGGFARCQPFVNPLRMCLLL